MFRSDSPWKSWKAILAFLMAMVVAILIPLARASLGNEAQLLASQEGEPNGFYLNRDDFSPYDIETTDTVVRDDGANFSSNLHWRWESLDEYKYKGREDSVAEYPTRRADGRELSEEESFNQDREMTKDLMEDILAKNSPLTTEFLPSVINVLNSYYNIPSGINIEVSTVSCGPNQPNAVYIPDRGENQQEPGPDNKIFLCAELLTDALNTFNKIGFDKLDDPYVQFLQREMERERTVLGGLSNAAASLWTWVFILYHEAGHALADIFNLPVLFTVEEDAVDIYAAYLLNQISQEGRLPKVEVQMILFSALKWFESSDDDAADYWSLHGLPEQRKSNLACFWYGTLLQDDDSGQARAVLQNLYGESLNDLLGDDRRGGRRGSCVHETTKNIAVWNDLLKNYKSTAASGAPTSPQETPSQEVAVRQPNFSCNLDPTPSTFVDGNLFISWESRNFEPNYPPQERCNQVSSRLNSYANLGLLESPEQIVYSVQNDHWVICVGDVHEDGERGRCTLGNMIVTLGHTENVSERQAQQALQEFRGALQDPTSAAPLETIKENQSSSR